jgi:hypothetical protein
MSAKINELKLKKALRRFCVDETTGWILAKLADGNIVHVETMEQTFPRVAAPVGKPDALPEKCAAFIERFIGTDFFGDIVIDILKGRIIDVKVKKIYRPHEIDKEVFTGASK